ncbi:HET-domain-containing protein [Thozetella sp. PMI_491]|nr:HET-domain-containing protein [Thozetella sp. PMI_491]
MDQSATILQRYRPLEDGCIRLLSLQPSTDSEAKVECNLAPAKIIERAYEALSYVWGQEEAIHSISVNGEAVLVRPNLYTALKELRLTDEPRILWVDSICINQLDIGERNHQVRQMGLIFSTAIQVVVWLGQGDDYTDGAIDFIHRLSGLDQDTARRITENNGLSWEYRKQVFRALGMVHGLDDHARIVGGLVKLMGFAWWTRIWTVQEIVLARSAILRCGAKSTSWDYLSKLAAFALQVSHHNTLGWGRPMVEAVFDEITGQISRLYLEVSSLSDLSVMVANRLDINLEQMAWSQLLTRQATEPRDMIYALLGLAKERSAIEIDYGRSKKEVYGSAMIAMLRQDHGGPGPLRFLQDCDLERDAALPSWVPDFGIMHSFKTTSLAASGVGVSLILKPLYNASFGDTRYKPPSFPGDGSILEMEGVPVDRVERLGDVCPHFLPIREMRETQLRSILDVWREMVEGGDPYIGGDSSLEAFWRTVTFDLELVDRDYLAGNPDRRDKRLRKGAPGMPPTIDQEAEVLEGILDAPLPKTVLEKLGGRRFFVTKKGYCGLGPALMQAGDMVCVLRGSSFPTLIRPKHDNKYAIVGESFVYGIMDGEMIEAVKKGISVWENFSFI